MAHAEAALVLGNDGHDDVHRLVEIAARINGGFTGFAATAHLVIAEGLSIVDPDTPGIQRALSEAEDAAQNLLDPALSARMTARIAALRTRWWPGPQAAEIPNIVKRLVDSPGDAVFAALHTVGEQYPLRQRELPAKNPATMQELSEAYQRPLTDFLQLNPQYATFPDVRLPQDTPIAVPDPNLAPLLAARLAAAALAAGIQQSMQWSTVASTIQQVVPATRSDATSAGTVIARLILAQQDGAHDQLERLQALTARLLPHDATIQ
jgi:hypothetical protein